MDNPDLDGTDFEPPAWWRGNAAGIASVVRVLNRLLNQIALGHDKPAFGDPDLQALALRLVALSPRVASREEAPSGLDACLGEVRRLERQLREIEPAVRSQCDMATYSSLQELIVSFVAIRDYVTSLPAARSSPSDASDDARTVLVTSELVEILSADWSRPVQVRIGGEAGAELRLVFRDASDDARDAARYRFLRQCLVDNSDPFPTPYDPETESPEGVDAAVDAGMAAARPLTESEKWASKQCLTSSPEGTPNA